MDRLRKRHRVGLKLKWIAKGIGRTLPDMKKSASLIILVLASATEPPTVAPQREKHGCLQGCHEGRKERAYHC